MSHSSEKSLRIEESRHPENIGPSFKTPTAKLTISLKAQCTKSQAWKIPRKSENKYGVRGLKKIVISVIHFIYHFVP